MLTVPPNVTDIPSAPSPASNETNPQFQDSHCIILCCESQQAILAHGHALGSWQRHTCIHALQGPDQ